MAVFISLQRDEENEETKPICEVAYLRSNFSQIWCVEY